MNLNMREQLVTLAVALAAVAVFVLALALPRTHSLADVRREHVELEQYNEKLARENATITAAHDEVVTLRQALDIAGSRVPREDHFAEYENNLLRLGEQFGLWSQDTEPHIVDSTLTAERSNDGLQARSMKLNLTAEFGKFYDFLQALESQTKLTRIERLEIKPVNEFGNLFTIELELTLFYGRL